MPQPVTSVSLGFAAFGDGGAQTKVSAGATVSHLPCQLSITIRPEARGFTVAGTQPSRTYWQVADDE